MDDVISNQGLKYMEVFKTYLFFQGHDEGHEYLIDTIFYENEWWLVGNWLQSNDTGEKFPGTIVRLTGLQYQEVNVERYKFLLNNSLPKSVLNGEPQKGYVIKNYPMASDMPGPKTKH